MQCKSGDEGDNKAGRALTKIQDLKKKSRSGAGNQVQPTVWL